MRVVVQRVEGASAEHEDREIARIGSGVVLYVGVSRDEAPGAGTWLAGELRRLARPGDEILCLSQFTLFASFRGPRPSFHRAEAPQAADACFSSAVAELCSAFPGRVKRGLFGKALAVALSGARMDTLLLERDAS